MISVREIAKESLLQNVFRHASRPRKEKVNGEGAFQWAVLIVDEKSSTFLQSCMETKELTAENIASFEMIENFRPHVDMHAIYFLSSVRQR